MAHRVRIVETSGDDRPRWRVTKSIGRLLDSVTERQLAGLDAVVLTSGRTLNHAERRKRVRRRGRKVRVAEALGFYHRASSERPAWIELRVDPIFADVPPLIRLLAPMRTLILATVLFHELGHHLHATQAPEHRKAEDVADDWQRALTRAYLLRQHRWSLRVVRALVRFSQWVLRREGVTAPPAGSRSAPPRKRRSAGGIR